MKKVIFTLVIVFSFFTEGKSQPGSLNTHFGHNGIVKTKLEGNGNTISGDTRSTFVQSDGKILTVVELSFMVVINRRLADGGIDSSYGKNGFSVDVEMINPAAALQSDGKIVVVGATTSFGSDFIAVRFTTDGKLDKTFGNKGVTITDAGSETDALASVAIQSNGKIVAGGQTSRNGTSQFALIRYTEDGAVDSSYGSQGLVITNFGNACNINSIALTTDNKVVAVGDYNNGSTSDFAIARYLKTGALDITFNGSGEVTSNFGNSDNAISVAIDTTGKIVVGGYYTDPSNNSHFEIARYTTNGSLDPSFNGSGVTGTNFGSNQEILAGMALQSNGEITAGGYIWQNNYVPDLALARFTVNGSLDSSFGINGQALDVMGSNDYNYMNCLTIAANGQILSGGESYYNNEAPFTLSRFNPTGSLDSSFGSDGNLFGYYPGDGIGYSGAMLQSDGKIVVNGTTSSSIASIQNFLARFKQDGSPDLSYGNNGMANTNGYNAVMQTDQKVVESNYYYDSAGGVETGTGIMMSRYKSDGSPDLTYGTNGIVLSDFFGGIESYGPTAIQRDNKVVVAGYINNNVGSDVLLARYNTDGTPDPTFGTGGAIIADFEPSDYPQTIAIGNGGKILIGEVGYTASYQLVIVVARFNSNGSIDSSFAINGQMTLSFGVEAFPGVVVLQNDGKILLSYEESNDYSTFYSYVTRFKSNGVTDSSFGTNGTIAVGGANLWLENDQKLLVSGNVTDAQNNNNISIARYNTNGTIDDGFGVNGTTITKIVQGESIVAGAAVSAIELIVAGYGSDPLGIAFLAEYQLGVMTITIDSPDVVSVVAQPLLASGGDLTITPAPNPTNNSFNIHLSSGNQLSSVTLQLINNQGTVLQTIPDLYPGQTVNIGASLHPGIYYLKVFNGNSAKTIKLMKL
jgi:uncharacterized delta-60 repeat protein